MAIDKKPNKKYLIMEDVVTKMGGTIEDFVPERGTYYVNVLGKKILLEYHISIGRHSYNNVISTKCKEITYKLLVMNGLQSPKTLCFYRENYNRANALEKLNSLKYPVVTKNANGSNSSGVSTNVLTAKKASKIVEKELLNFTSVIAQEMVFGKEYRLLVLDERIIGALEMIHPYVIGDGIATVKNLIKTKQNNTKRRTKFDKALKQILKDQNSSLRDVPKKGKTIYFKRNSCLAEGGETKDVTSIVHKDVKKIGVDASKAVGKFLVGIDIICKDISKKQTKNSVSILEINGKPDFYIHYNPTHGKSRNVLKEILKFLTKLTFSISPDDRKNINE